MRSDFLGPCASFERLNNVLNAHLIQVGPMRQDELRAAIELPAFKVSCELEPGLTERLLADVEGQAGALPLLQFTLNDLWQRREVRRLTLRAYTELGGVEGALEHRANETLQKLSQADQDLCRRIFLHLVQPGEGTEDTKRRVTYHELLPDDPERAEAVERVVGVLADRDARLITTEGTGTADGAVEVAHEALIRGWGRLRQWIDADRVGLRIHRQLIEAAREWEANGRDSSFLYGGTRLAVAREWAKSHRDELNALEAEFLAASRGKRLKLKLALAASILVMMAVVIGVWQRLQWQKRNQLAHFYQANVWFAEGEDDKAIAAFGEAIRFDPKFIQAYFFRGLVRAEKKKEYDKAIADYDQAIGLDPKLAMAYNGRGNAWADKRRTTRRSPTTTRRSASTPNSPWRTTAAATPGTPSRRTTRPSPTTTRRSPSTPSTPRRTATAATPGTPSRTYDKAIADYDQAIAPRPQDRQGVQQPRQRLARQAGVRQGDRRLRPGDRPRPQARPGVQQPRQRLVRQAGRTTRPSPTTTRRSPSTPSSPRRTTTAAYVWHAKQEYDKAIADYDQAIALDPKLAMAYNNRGTPGTPSRTYDKAIADYDQAIALDPKYAMAYSNRGNAWYAKQAYDKAIADYDQAIALDPKLRPGVQQPRQRLVRQAGVRQGHRRLRPGDRPRPQVRPGVQQPRQRLERQAGVRQGHRRLRPGDRASTPSSPRRTATAATPGTTRGSTTRRSPTTTRRSPSTPSSPWRTTNRAWLWATCPDEKYRDGKKAVESATRACELTDWKDADSLDTLAAACAEAGDFDAAVKWQEKALGMLAKDDEPNRKDFEARLTLYRAKKPYHVEPKAERAGDRSARAKRP